MTLIDDLDLLRLLVTLQLKLTFKRSRNANQQNQAAKKRTMYHFCGSCCCPCSATWSDKDNNKMCLNP